VNVGPRALVVIAALAGTALADGSVAPPPPDPAATYAGEEANLESKELRRGFVGGGALGGSFTTGSTTGSGGALSLWLGQVATPRTVVLFEVAAATQFKRIDETSGLIADNVTSVLAGAQHWLGPSLWVRLTGGLGVYRCNQCDLDGDGRRETFTRGGVSGGFAIGLDVVRWRGLVLGLQASSVNQLSRVGLLSANSLGLALSFD
jgi:hypothetical protein